MLGNAEEGSVNNQLKIQQLKQRIKNADFLQPKSPFQDSPVPLSVPPTPNNPRNDGVHPLELQLTQLQERLAARLEAEARLLENAEAELGLLQEEARTARRQAERSRQMTQARAQGLQQQASQQVLQQIEEIRALRKDLVDSIDKKYRTIKTETMAVLGSHFENDWEEARDTLSSHLEQLRSRADRDENTRDEATTYMVNSFGEEILKLQQLVGRERQQRLESQQRALESLQHLEEEMTGLLLQEKREAALGIADLENTLEQLCLKIENYLLR